MSIDYEKVEGFKALDPKDAKTALATYAQEEFDVKLNKQKSFENMLTDLEQATFTPAPDLSILDTEKPETAEYTGETVYEEPVINAPLIPDVALETTSESVEPVVPGSANTETFSETPETGYNDTKNKLDWLVGFYPSIVLMGRNPSNNGYYTCPWWIFDWIKQNPGWYNEPEKCPHYSAIETLKSLVYYISRDGYVTVRETRNSQFYKLSFDD